MVVRSGLLVSILGALSACSTSFSDRGCMRVPPEQTSCPTPDQVNPKDLFLPDKCGDDLEIDEVNGGGTLEKLAEASGAEGQACCYPVTVTDHNTNQECTIGRPYIEAGVQRAAALRNGALEGPVLDARRAALWAKAGAEEHASVASFSRLSLELMALGAPTALLADVQRAALDEIRHAEACWELARHFGGMSVTAGEFPFAAPVDARVTHAELAYAAAREGCLGETLGAHLAAAAAGLAPEPAVRKALEAIAAEEAEHAVLSFRIVLWALQTGGAPARAAVERAFREPWPEPALEELALRANVELGALRAASAEGISDVLAPATEALLAA